MSAKRRLSLVESLTKAGLLVELAIRWDCERRRWKWDVGNCIEKDGYEATIYAYQPQKFEHSSEPLGYCAWVTIGYCRGGSAAEALRSAYLIAKGVTEGSDDQQLKPISSEHENNQALKMVEALMFNKERTPEQSRLLEATILRVEAYEKEHYPISGVDNSI